MDLDCENGFINVQNETKASYKIIFSQKIYGDESFEFSEGIIVIKEIDDLLTQNQIVEMIAQIGVENKMTKVVALRSCDVFEFYIHQSELSSQQKNILEENLIAELNIDLKKSLSKTERIQHKKKRDLIELVSNKSCKQLEKLDISSLTAEKFTQVVSSLCAEYTEETMEVYELPFEQSANQFITDITEHLFSNCEILMKMIKE